MAEAAIGDTGGMKGDKRARIFHAITRSSGWLEALGFSWLVPLLRMAAGDNPRLQSKELVRVLVIPLIGILGFLILWGSLAPKIETSLGAVPGPVQVWEK